MKTPTTFPQIQRFWNAALIEFNRKVAKYEQNPKYINHYCNQIDGWLCLHILMQCKIQVFYRLANKPPYNQKVLFTI